MKNFVIALAIVTALSTIGCTGGSTSESSNSNPVPAVTSISPNSAVAGGAAFTVTINGTNFVAGSTVNFSGTAPATTFVSATQLTAAIPAAAIASAGSANVTATNPAPGGGTSNAVQFTITSSSNPVPIISSLSPNCAPEGEQVLNPFVMGLLVNGQNFSGNSVVRWNGSDRSTSFSSASQLIAQISSADTAAAGTATVTVFNPAPGGGISNSMMFTITSGGVNPQSIAVDHTGKFAYVASQGCGDSSFGNVSMFSIDATTGVLTSIGSPISSNDEGARSVAVDPSSKFVYVANWGEGDTTGSVAASVIDGSTGNLTVSQLTSGPCPGLCAPWSVAVHPSGKFVYVADEGGFAPTGISVFTINTTTGALTSTGTVPAAGRADSVAVDPTGKFAYVANSSNSSPGVSNSVSMYSINSTTGALTSIGTIAAGTDPESVAVDPTGKFVYVANSGSNDVSMYAINTTTGALTSMGTIAAGTGPVSVAVDPAGKFAYVANSGSNDVSIFAINAASGILTRTAAVAAGSSPSSIAIHPSGNFAYVTNSNSNDISMYSINTTTGALTLIGTVGS